MQGKPFVVLGVNTNGYNPAKLKEVMQKEDIPWRTFADNDRKISGAWKLQGTPTMYVVDHKGVIREFWLGNPGATRIEQRVEELVKEAEKVAAAPAEDGRDRFAAAPATDRAIHHREHSGDREGHKQIL